MLRRLCLLVVGLVLAGCSSGGGGGLNAGVLGGPDVDSLTVTKAEQAKFPGAVRRSPDGEHVLRLYSDPCVMKADGSGEKCVEPEKVNPDLTNAAWSPDGTKLTFTDDFWRRFDEPDVWVFDVTTGDLRNLTDDGERKFQLGGENETAQLDLLPSWSADGETIQFARGRAKSDTMQLMSVPADGGEVSSLRQVRCEPAQLVGLAWSASRVAWTCGVNAGEVFLADRTGGDAERVLPAKEPEDRMQLSFSPDGSWLLIDSVAQYADFGEVKGGLAVAVPSSGGDPVPVAKGVGWPTWSPRGHALAYVEMPNRVMVVSKPGGEPRELRKAEHILTAMDGRRLDWTGDTLLVGIDSEPTMLTLSE
jgi:WD40-like Beta Propeller Repeat